MWDVPLSLFEPQLVVMALAFLGSGIVRGFNGGAGANFLTAPVMAALIGPREAVPIILLLNGATNIQLLPGALPSARLREALPIGLAGALTLPLGAWALFAVDEDVMRRAVAGVAVIFALVLLSGWRYRGQRGTGISIAAGATGGMLAGAVSLGGPPVFLYLMSGAGNAALNRAHFIVFSGTIQVVAIFVLFGAGVFSERMLWLAALLVVPLVLGTGLGIRFYRSASEDQFRRYSLWGMVIVSLAILIF